MSDENMIILKSAIINQSPNSLRQHGRLYLKEPKKNFKNPASVQIVQEAIAELFNSPGITASYIYHTPDLESRQLWHADLSGTVKQLLHLENTHHLKYSDISYSFFLVLETCTTIWLSREGFKDGYIRGKFRFCPQPGSLLAISGNTIHAGDKFGITRSNLYPEHLLRCTFSSKLNPDNPIGNLKVL
jgi:hypothetical protein